MLDTGAQPNLIKIGSLNSNIHIDPRNIIHLTGITDSVVNTLGTARIYILRVPVTFHVVTDDFPIIQQGILGSSFFTEHNAQIDYGTQCVSWRNHIFPFKERESIIVPARSNTGFVIRISNPEIKTGHVPRLHVEDGIFLGDCLVNCINEKGYIRVINTTEQDIELLIPTVKLQEIAGISSNSEILEHNESLSSNKTLQSAQGSTIAQSVAYACETPPNLTNSSLLSAQGTTKDTGNIPTDTLPTDLTPNSSISNSNPMGNPKSSVENRLDQILNLLRLNHLNSEEKLNVQQLVESHQDRFHLPNEYLEKTLITSHRILTKDEVPIHTKQYRFPPIHKSEIDKQVSDLVNGGIVIPSGSPYNSPVWIVPKKADSQGNRRWRMVIDYRNLNEKTIGDAYPLPNICDILDQLGGAKYFSVLDLASGFHQIPMHPSDAHKTAFSTPHGHFEFDRMPFGLKNAPATFQRLMDQTLCGLQGVELFVYMDDIVIYASSLREHDIKISKLMDRLRKANLKLQPDKCEFLRREVAYLGHLIGEDGVKPNPEKISAIQNFPTPRNAKNIKQFLGLAGYYRRFIPNFSGTASPLSNLLKKGTPFCWSRECQKSFETLKEALCHQPILQYPDFSRPFVLTTDASKYAIGGLLSQGPIGQDLPIAYASRVLNAAERNYSTIEKELLAITYCVQHFRSYLYGHKFTLVTDHQPLTWLARVKDPTSRLMRWRLKLEEYDYNIVYKKGSLNRNADALSRNPPSYVTIEEVDDDDEGKGNEQPPQEQVVRYVMYPIRKKQKLYTTADKDWAGSESDSEDSEASERPRKYNLRRRKLTRRRINREDTEENEQHETSLDAQEKFIKTRESEETPTIVPTPLALEHEDSTRVVDKTPSNKQKDPVETRESEETPITVPTPLALEYEPSARALIEEPPDNEFGVEQNSMAQPDPQSEDSDASDESIDLDDEMVTPQSDPKVSKVTRDKLRIQKDNLVIMVTADGHPFDAGAHELAAEKLIPPLIELTLGRARVFPSLASNKQLITLPVKERRTIALDPNMLQEAFQSLLDVTIELGLSSFSIAKTNFLDQIQWRSVLAKLQNIFQERPVAITICLGLTSTPPEDARSQIISEYHRSAFAGHKGVTKTYLRIRENYYWENMKKQVQEFIRQCRECQLKKLVRLKTRQPMVITDTPSTAFDKIALDIMGPLPRTFQGYAYVLTIQDLLTKYSVAIAMRSTSAEETAFAFVNNFICRFGCPRAILTDQGTNFVGNVMKNIAKCFNIQHFRTTTYHPQSNGSVERSHHVFMEYLKVFVDPHQDWDQFMERASFAYNTSVHEGTKHTPHELVFGRTARMPTSQRLPTHEPETYPQYLVDLFTQIRDAQEKAKRNLEQAKSRSKMYYDRRLNSQNFQVGDHVFMLIEKRLNKFSDEYTGPYEILEILDHNNVKIRYRNSTKVVHANKLKISYLIDPG